MAHGDLKEAIAHCEKVRDYVSRELLHGIMESEETIAADLKLSN